MIEPVYLPAEYELPLLFDSGGGPGDLVLHESGVRRLPRTRAPAKRLAALQALQQRVCPQPPLPAHGWRGR